MLCFVDESGDLSNYVSGSKYFICTAVLMYDYAPILGLHELRHVLAHEGYSALPAGFHAKNDVTPLRRRVFKLLGNQQIFIHSVALKKSEVFQNLRNNEAFVYRIACRILFKSLFTNFLADVEEHSIVFSTFATGRVSAKLQSHQNHIMFEFGSVHAKKRVAFWDASTHAGLQIADYCSWMIQRHLENPSDPLAVEFKKELDSRIVSIHTPWD